MPIIYASVARGSTILAEFTKRAGNFTTVVQAILQKIPPQDSKMSYTYDRYLFHYIAEDGLIYICMADEEFGRRIPFSFLEDIKARFRTTYGDSAKTAFAYGFNDEFSRVLSSKMEFYSNPENDRMTQARGQVDEVRQVMVSNIEKVLDRGERIEILVDKSENLNQQAFQFKKKSTQLKRAMWWKNTKLMVMLVFVVIALLYFLISAACGGLNWPCMHSSSSSNPPAPAPTNKTRRAVDDDVFVFSPVQLEHQPEVDLPEAFDEFAHHDDGDEHESK
eukprot:Colp12_sorted_trinity150504_noHs@27315